MQRSERRLRALMSCGCLLWAALIGAQLGRTHARQDDTGAVRELLADTLTSAERRWLVAHPVVRYSALPGGDPMAFLGVGGHAAGIGVQALEQIGRVTGLRFEPVWHQDSKASEAALRDGTVLLVPALPADWPPPGDLTQVREAADGAPLLQPSLPYLITPLVITTQAANRAIRDAAGLAGMRIAVRPGSEGLAERLRQVPDAIIIRTNSSVEGYRLVAHGQADAMVDTLACAQYMVRHAFAPWLRVAGPFGSKPAAIRFGVSQSAPQLRMILNKALAAIPPRQWDAMQARWSTAPPALPGQRRGERQWLLTCSLGTLLWATALAACAAALHRHGRRLTKAARALHRRLASARTPTARRSAADARSLREAVHRASLSCPAASPSADRLGLLATICHEIRTPMHAVIGILELLMHKSAIHGETRHYIDAAHDCAKSLVTLVGDVLDMAKLEAGRMEIRPEPVQLDALIEQLVHTFRPLAASRELRIQMQLGTLRARRHRVDPQRLRQIVGNLLSNAIKYSTHGEIAVMLHSDGDCGQRETVRIVVRDQGPGIAPEHLPRLFEPFFRAAESGAASGTGLGLSISRQLARQMGGELELMSQLGIGTIALLTLTLPTAAGCGRTPGGNARPAAYRRSAITPLRKGYCALVVDDHPASRMLLARQLRHLGVDAVGAANAQEALARCSAPEAAFDLVILDCNMPGMDGFTLARELRAQERALSRRHTPLLGYSADARPHNRQRALAAGMDDCLFKPIDLDTLARALKHWLADAPVAPSATPMSEAPAGDAAVRAALLAGNTADLAALRLAVASADWQAAGEIAHRIKGAARLVSAEAVAARCEALETACRNGDAAGVAAAMAALVPTLAQWAKALST